MSRLDKATASETLGLLASVQDRLRKDAGIDLTQATNIKMPTVWVYRLLLALFVGFWAIGTAWFCVTYMTREQANQSFVKREEVAQISAAMTSITTTQQSMTVSLAVINASMARVGSLEERIREMERELRAK